MGFGHVLMIRTGILLQVFCIGTPLCDMIPPSQGRVYWQTKLIVQLSLEAVAVALLFSSVLRKYSLLMMLDGCV